MKKKDSCIIWFLTSSDESELKKAVWLLSGYLRSGFCNRLEVRHKTQIQSLRSVVFTDYYRFSYYTSCGVSFSHCVCVCEHEQRFSCRCRTDIETIMLAGKLVMTTMNCHDDKIYSKTPKKTKKKRGDWFIMPSETSSKREHSRHTGGRRRGQASSNTHITTPVYPRWRYEGELKLHSCTFISRTGLLGSKQLIMASYTQPQIQ